MVMVSVSPLLMSMKGFGVGATYAKSDRTDGQVAYGKSKFNASGKNAEVWAAGLKYDANNIYLSYHIF